MEADMFERDPFVFRHGSKAFTDCRESTIPCTMADLRMLKDFIFYFCSEDMSIFHTSYLVLCGFHLYK